MSRLPHGPSLETILRRAFGEGVKRISAVEELLEALDCWERRAPLPVVSASKPTGPIIAAKGQSPATWDPIVDEFSCGSKRLEAILDAAEQMRQSVEPEKPVGVTAAPRSSKWPELRRPSSRSPADGRGPKSVEPKQRRRQASIGPELAAFAARSRPKTKPWLIGFGIVGALSVVAFNLWPYLETEFANGPSALSSSRSSTDSGSVAEPSNRVTARPRLTAREETSQCITSYFREGAVQKGVDLGFVCAEEDFLNVTRRLHEESMNPGVVQVPDVVSSVSAPQPSIPPSPVDSAASPVPAAAASANRALVVRSGTNTLGWQLGWYELVATAIIRQNCCREAVPIKLPETTGWCQQLQGVVRRIASDSAKVGDISPGVRSFDETITCLSAQGKHVVYPYKAVPSNLQKAAFQQFLKHAAEVDAQRSAHR